MTRTERSTFPRALVRDRSESKSGMDKALRKGGAGGHNWGNIEQEYFIEADALNDEPVAKKEASTDKPEPPRPTSVTSDEDLAAAREVRKRALKDSVDLASIARSSAAVSSS